LGEGLVDSFLSAMESREVGVREDNLEREGGRLLGKATGGGNRGTIGLRDCGGWLEAVQKKSRNWKKRGL